MITRVGEDLKLWSVVEECTALAKLGNYKECRKKIDDGLKYIEANSHQGTSPTEFIYIVIQQIRQLHPMRDVYSESTGENTLEDCRFCIELNQLAFRINHDRKPGYFRGYYIGDFGDLLESWSRKCSRLAFNNDLSRKLGYMSGHNAYILLFWLTKIGEARYQEGHKDLGLKILSEVLSLWPYMKQHPARYTLKSYERYSLFLENETVFYSNLERIRNLVTKEKISWCSYNFSLLSRYHYLLGLTDDANDLLRIALKRFGENNRNVIEIIEFKQNNCSSTGNIDPRKRWNWN